MLLYKASATLSSPPIWDGDAIVNVPSGIEFKLSKDHVVNNKKKLDFCVAGWLINVDIPPSVMAISVTSNACKF